MFFWCPVLDPHLTTNHSNIGFCLRSVSIVGLLILVALNTSQAPHPHEVTTLNIPSSEGGTSSQSMHSLAKSL